MYTNERNGYKEGSCAPKQKRGRKTSIKWTAIPWWKFAGWAGYFTLRDFTKIEYIELGEWCTERDLKDWQFTDSTGDVDAMSEIDIHGEKVEEIFNNHLRIYFKSKNDATMFKFTWGG